MPRRSKKRKPNPEPEPSSSSSSENDSDQDESNQEENIQIDLEARALTDSDHSAVLYFIEQSFGNSIKKSILDLNQLATQLISQQSFGSVFYQPSDSTTEETDDDEDDDSPVLGVCSLLPFDQQQNNKQLYAWLLEKSSNNEQAKTILQTSKCALFVNERYMNIPAEISLPAIRTLRSEVPFQLDYWIIHGKLRLLKKDPTTIYYINGEEEIFVQHSTTSVDYTPNQTTNNEWTQCRKIIFVSTNKLDDICLDIELKLKQ